MLMRFWSALPIPICQFALFVFIFGILGVIIFFVGESLPRESFNYDAFPYRSFGWERDGAIYDKLQIRRWKDVMPDMSKLVPHIFPKKIRLPRDPAYTRQLILETCSAEFVHYILILLSPIFAVCMKDAYGIAGMIVYALGNLPFVLIQRYNRPRLIKLMNRQSESLARKKTQKAGV